MNTENTETKTECDYCGTNELAYDLESDRGTVSRCIPCLAVERGQQALKLPFDSFVNFEKPSFHDSEIEAREARERQYEAARDWYRVLARIRTNEPILKRDSDAIGTVTEDIRTFLTNIMGSDAHQPPSEIVDAEQSER